MTDRYTWQDTPDREVTVDRAVEQAPSPAPHGLTAVDEVFPGAGSESGYKAELGEFYGFYRNDPSQGYIYPYAEFDVGVQSSGQDGSQISAEAYLAAEDDGPDQGNYRATYLGGISPTFVADAKNYAATFSVSAERDDTSTTFYSRADLRGPLAEVTVATHATLSDAIPNGNAGMEIASDQSVFDISGGTAQQEPLIKAHCHDSAMTFQVLPSGDVLLANQGQPGSGGIVLQSADGSYWRLAVSDTGTISAEPWTPPPWVTF